MKKFTTRLNEAALLGVVALLVLLSCFAGACASQQESIALEEVEVSPSELVPRGCDGIVTYEFATISIHQYRANDGKYSGGEVVALGSWDELLRGVETTSPGETIRADRASNWEIWGWRSGGKSNLILKYKRPCVYVGVDRESDDVVYILRAAL